ncbi:MAG: hypothetical protein ACTHJV_15105 [Rhizobiaceae bacterium]
MENETGFDPRWNGQSIPKYHWHFHRQLWERYGIVLAPGEFSQMLRDIKTGRATVIERLSDNRVIYMVRNKRLLERYFVVVRDGYIITALPPSKRLKKLRRELPS